MPVVGKKEERDMPSSPFMQKTFVMLKLLMQERRVHGRIYEPQKYSTVRFFVICNYEFWNIVHIY